MNYLTRLLCFAGTGLLLMSGAQAVDQRTVNNGNLILEDVPEIPQSLIDDLNRYQNTRSASLRGWTYDSDSIYITTRFGQVSQLHRVDSEGGARFQLTFFNEPIRAVARQKFSDLLAYTMDAGGNEFSQIFFLDPETGDSRMVSDGESRNQALLWSNDGKMLAFQSTRRNGRSNDIWIMDPEDPASARVLLEAPDGAYWYPADWSRDNKRLLIGQYLSSTDSRIHVLTLDSGETLRLAGSDQFPSRNFPIGFNSSGENFFFVTDADGEFMKLAERALHRFSGPDYITADIDWDIEDAELGFNRNRGAFVVNRDGMSRVYLWDTGKGEYKRISSLPQGVVGSVIFSPDSRRLAVSVNTPRTPSDVYVIELGTRPLAAKDVNRWTRSEVGGLDTDSFVVPELVTFPTFDEVDGRTRQIPAYVYRPEGDGPFPVVIYIHGGPESQERPEFYGTFQLWLAKLGVAIVAPNVRGSEGYGKTYVALDNGFRREDSVKDIGALLDWIAAQDDLDESRVAVYGGSYGGYMVLASAMHYSDRLKAAVDIVGISNFVTFLENTQDYRRDLRRVEYGDERDADMRAFLDRISPNNNVDRITIPLLVAQGQNDPRVPVTESEQIVAAIRANGHKVWYMNALNEGHGFRKKENRDLYQQVVVMFLREHLLD